MYLFAAGGGYHNGRSYGDYCSEQGVHKLYTVYNEMPHLLEFNHPNTRLLADSGGHCFNKEPGGINVLGHARTSKAPDPIKYLSYYMSCVEKLKDKECGIFELDIYGHLSVDTIDGIYRDITSMKGKFKFIRCFHPLGIDGDYSLRTLKKWVDKQDYIAISKSSEACYNEIFKITRDKVRLHGLALTGPSTLTRYPFYSADSTNALVLPFIANTVILDSGERMSLTDALKRRRTEYLMYKDKEARLIQSIKAFKRAEEFYTRLWESRGIIWK